MGIVGAPDTRQRAHTGRHPAKISVSSFMGYLKGRSALTVFDRHANLECKFGDGRFWAEGRYVSTVGLDEATVAKCIGEREAADIALDRSGAKEHGDPFVKKWLRPFDGPATGQVAVRPERSEGRAPLDAHPAPQGLYPKSKPSLFRGGSDSPPRLLRHPLPSRASRCPARCPGG